jgi:hypothetical protein
MVALDAAAGSRRAGAVQLVLRHVDITENHGQQIIEVVRDSARQTSHGLHLLRVPQLLLQGYALGDVARYHQPRWFGVEHQIAEPNLGVNGRACLAEVALPHRLSNVLHPSACGFTEGYKLLDCHREKLLLGVFVKLNGGGIDGQELAAFRLANPHGQRIEFEQLTVALLGFRHSGGAFFHPPFQFPVQTKDLVVGGAQLTRAWQRNGLRRKPHE